MPEKTETELLEALIEMLSPLINYTNLALADRFEFARICSLAKECLEELRDEG